MPPAWCMRTVNCQRLQVQQLLTDFRPSSFFLGTETLLFPKLLCADNIIANVYLLKATMCRLFYQVQDIDYFFFFLDIDYLIHTAHQGA